MSLESLAATARDEETRTMVRAALEGAKLIRQLASDATYLRVASARPLTSISPASYARPGELLERASAPSHKMHTTLHTTWGDRRGRPGTRQ